MGSALRTMTPPPRGVSAPEVLWFFPPPGAPQVALSKVKAATPAFASLLLTKLEEMIGGPVAQRANIKYSYECLFTSHTRLYFHANIAAYDLQYIKSLKRVSVMPNLTKGHHAADSERTYNFLNAVPEAFCNRSATSRVDFFYREVYFEAPQRPSICCSSCYSDSVVLLLYVGKPL